MGNDENKYSLISLGDLGKLSRPLTKLIEVSAAGMGNVYRPLGVWLEGKAQASTIRALAAAKADAAREVDKLKAERQLALSRATEIVPR